MEKFAWTAAGLYELVKDLPDGARPIPSTRPASA